VGTVVTKRIIPCLDCRDGRVVKGVNFQGLQDAGSPVELSLRYQEEGADEIVILVLRPSLLYIPLSSLGTQAFVALMKLLRTLRIL
jgi:hypothetical protein